MVIERATGVDLITKTLQFALGQPVVFQSDQEYMNQCGSWVFGSSQEGQLADAPTMTALQARVPEVFEYVMNYGIGDKIPKFNHNGNSLGYVLFDCPPKSTCAEISASKSSSDPSI